LDGRLKGKKFVVGDRLTIADFSLGAPLSLAEMGRIPVEPYREIKRWYGTLRALPAWQKTQAQCALPAAARGLRLRRGSGRKKIVRGNRNGRRGIMKAAHGYETREAARH
jgi:glutathione S-transferase